MSGRSAPTREAILSLVGDTVREKREVKQWSQEELAFRCGLDRTYVGGVERGERNVGVVNLVRIAQALGVPASSLLEGLPS
jgi:transcriptional regulator with XRE-family HTH domain